MKIIVCYKLTPDAKDLNVKADGTLDIGSANWKIGEYDRPAIELGIQLAEKFGGTVSALSVGTSRISTSKDKKDILSRGPDDLFLVIDERLEDADSHLTARALAAAIQKMGSADLILCGEGSADNYAQQVGVQLGELLEMPSTNAVSRIEMMNDSIIAERNLEEELEILKMKLPAVLSVTTNITEPRVASMKMILAAGKKPVTIWDLDDIPLSGEKGNSRQVVSTLGPENVARKGVILSGSANEATQQLVTILSKDGVL